jgi:hypothetical protein
MRVHAICANEGIADDDAKLLTYMHVKGCESGRGVNYFIDPQEVDEEAIRILLGHGRATGDLIESCPAENSSNALLSLADRISALDTHFTRELGIENPLSAELRNRLRLYCDPLFRDGKIELYRRCIETQLGEYNRERVREAFRAYRRRKKQEEAALMQALEE